MFKFSAAYEYQAFRLLQIAFVILSVFRGLDKIVYFITGWTRFHSPIVLRFYQSTDKSFILAVGIVEVLIGIGIIFKPKFFAYLLAVWIIVIILNFISLGEYFDIGLRDVSLLLSTLALARLSHKFSS